MLPAGVLNIAITADFWQHLKPNKRNRPKLTSGCWPQQTGTYIDIKESCKQPRCDHFRVMPKSTKLLLLLLFFFFFFLFVTLFYLRDFSGTSAGTDTANTPLEPFPPIDVPLGVLLISHTISGVMSPATPIRGAWIGIFKPNVQTIKNLRLQYYRNYCIDSNQILHNDKDR